MKKRIFVNIFLAFVLETLIKLIRDYIKIEILNDHSNYSGGWTEYIKLEPMITFFISPLIFGMFVLLPYNLIILKKDVKKISLIKKIVYFLIVLVAALFVLGTFLNVWFYPYWRNIYYLVYFIPYSILFASIIHFWVDKKEE